MEWNPSGAAFALDRRSMMAPLLRPMTWYDHPVVAALWHDSWHDAHAHLLPGWVVALRTPQSFADRLNALTAQLFVAEIGGRIEGFGAVAGVEVYLLFLSRQARGTGTAAALLQRCESALKESGVWRGSIECAAGNARALAFYARQGWRSEGIIDRTIWMPPNYLAYHHPTCILVKDL